MKLDLHIHTLHSYDCFQSPERVLKTAERRGLDGIAVTDHNSFAGTEAVLEISKDFDLICIPGMEVRTEEYDDLLALFIQRPIEERSFDAVISEIQNQNGIAILPHPYRKFDSIPEWVLDQVDAIEGVNARSRSEDNIQARQLGEHHDLPMTGSSDAHTFLEIGRARTHITKSIDRTKPAIKDAIIDGHIKFKGSESPYYLFHGLSVAMERIKEQTGFKHYP